MSTDQDTRADLIKVLTRQIVEGSLLLDSIGTIRAKPLIGGVFGANQFAICSIHFVTSGLDGVFHLVMDVGSRIVIGGAPDKQDALKAARSLLSILSGPELLAISIRVKDAREHLRQERQKKEEQQLAAADAIAKAVIKKVRGVPKRRQRIFEASQGLCHYCSTPLTLDGAWHVEHKMPKALGGSDDQINLVASCVPCNVEKRDRTDLEFIASRKAAK